MKRTAAWAPKNPMTPAAALAQTLRYRTQCQALDGTTMRAHVGLVLEEAGIRFRRAFASETGARQEDFYAIGAAAAILIVVDRPSLAVELLAKRIARHDHVTEIIVVAARGKLGYMPTSVVGKPLHVVHLAAGR